MSRELLLDAFEKSLPPVIEDFLPRDLPTTCFVSEYTQSCAKNEHPREYLEVFRQIAYQELATPSRMMRARRTRNSIRDARIMLRRQKLLDLYLREGPMPFAQLATQLQTTPTICNSDFQYVCNGLCWRWGVWKHNNFEDPFVPKEKDGR